MKKTLIAALLFLIIARPSLAEDDGLSKVGDKLREKTAALKHKLAGTSDKRVKALQALLDPKIVCARNGSVNFRHCSHNLQIGSFGISCGGGGLVDIIPGVDTSSQFEIRGKMKAGLPHSGLMGDGDTILLLADDLRGKDLQIREIDSTRYLIYMPNVKRDADSLEELRRNGALYTDEEVYQAWNNVLAGLERARAQTVQGQRLGRESQDVRKIAAEAAPSGR